MELAKTYVAPETEDAADLLRLVTVIYAANVLCWLPEHRARVIKLADKLHRAKRATSILRIKHLRVLSFGNAVASFEIPANPNLAVLYRIFSAIPFAFRTVLFGKLLRPRPAVRLSMLSAQVLKPVRGCRFLVELGESFRSDSKLLALRALFNHDIHNRRLAHWLAFRQVPEKLFYCAAALFLKCSIRRRSTLARYTESFS